jgi:hypothetical protein
MTDLRDTSEIVPVPLRTPDGVLHNPIDKLTRIGWFRGDTVALLLTNRIYLVDPADPARTITWVDTPGPVADFDVDGSRIFVSLVGNSWLYQLIPGSRQLIPDHDFGPAGGVEHLQVAGDEAVVVGGGGIYHANLVSHRQTAIPDFGLAVTQIALARRSRELIAQARDVFQGGFDLVAFQLP